MYENVIEGKSIIKIKKTDKISKEMDVFYNPVMKLNRDISILLLNSINKENMRIALPLAGSGVRGIRFLKELNNKKIKSICFNDYSNKAFFAIKNNLKLNNIKNFSTIKKINNQNNINIKNKKIIDKLKFDKEIKNKKLKNNENYYNKILIFNQDANLFLLNSSGFDYIDIDPFGSSNAFLDSAVKRLSRNGILAVTNTDTAALTGTYPKACVRKYWALPKRDYMMHETGLRILIRKVQLIGMQYDKALFPIFSYFKDHYFRIFFQCVKGKKECDKIAELHNMLNDAGPLWTGRLWDNRLVNKICLRSMKKINFFQAYKAFHTLYTIKNSINDEQFKKILKNVMKNESSLKKSINNKTRENRRFSVNLEIQKEFPVSQKSQSDFLGSQKSLISVKSPKSDLKLNNINIRNKKIKIIDKNNEILKFLRIIKDESKINAAGFYDIHQISKSEKLKTMIKKEDLIKKIKLRGFTASNTHFSGIGIRSNIPYGRLIALLKE